MKKPIRKYRLNPNSNHVYPEQVYTDGGFHPDVVVINPLDLDALNELAEILDDKIDSAEAMFDLHDMARWLGEMLSEYRDPPPKHQVYTHLVKGRRVDGILFAYCGKTWTPNHQTCETVGKCPDCQHELDRELEARTQEIRDELGSYGWEY